MIVIRIEKHVQMQVGFKMLDLKEIRIINESLAAVAAFNARLFLTRRKTACRFKLVREVNFVTAFDPPYNPKSFLYTPLKYLNRLFK